MKNYTLVLYKSDGCNTCRGCVMEQWGSDFSVDTGIAEAEVVENIANAFTRPSDGGGYEARVFGVREDTQIIHTFDQSSNWQGTKYTNTTHSILVDWETDENEGNRLQGLINKRVTEILEDRRLSIENEKVRQKKKEEKQKEQFERQQLAALQKKYEGTKII